MQFDTKPTAHMKGHVMWAVINDDGSVADNGTLEPRAPSNNLILDQGLNSLMSNKFASLFEYVCIGTGTSTPVSSQVELDNEHARTGNTKSALCGTTWPPDGSSPYTIVMKRGWDFPKGSLDSSVDGAYAELGFSSQNTVGQNLFSRTLIKDDTGTAITISVASGQILRVAYEIEYTVGPSSPASGSVSITNIGTLNYSAQIENLFNQLSYVDGNGGTVIDNGVGAFEPSGGLKNNSMYPLVFENSAATAFVGPKKTDSDFGGYSNPAGSVTTTNPSTGVYRYEIFLGTAEANMAGVKHIVIGLYSNVNGLTFEAIRFQMDSGSEFTKEDTHELTLEFEVTFTAN